MILAPSGKREHGSPAMGVNFTDTPLVGVKPSDGHLVVRVFEHGANILGNEPRLTVENDGADFSSPEVG